jgi:hypothetical protein
MSQAPATPTPVIADLTAPALALYRMLEALDRDQDRAERRIGLGARFARAAAAETGRHHRMIQELKADQQAFREQAREDLAPAAQAGEVEATPDDGVTTAIKSLEARMARLQSDWTRTQERIAEMLRRSETLLR